MRHKFVRSAAVYAVLFSFIFFVSPVALYKAKAAIPQNPISLDAQGAILIDMQSGKVLYQKNENERLYPASTTKILTALLSLQYGNLDDTITVGKEVLMIPWDSSKAFLQEGEQIKLKDLLMGLLLPSGNDAAMTAAVYIGRKVSNDMSLDETKAIDKFVQLMNERAKELGATNSNFVNPHGYDDPNHYATPHDLALIAREAMKNEFFREIVSTSKYSEEDTSVSVNGQPQEDIEHTWKNTNALIDKSSKDYYEYATGIKTGYTTPAGHCVVSSASRNGVDLIAVVMDDSTLARWDDSKKLLDYGFENFMYYSGTVKNQVVSTLKVDNPSSNSPKDLTAVSDEDFNGTFNNEDASKIQKSIVWDKNFISQVSGQDDEVKLISSIEANQVIGKMIFTLDGNVLKEINLKAQVSVKKQTFWGAVIKTIGTDNIEIFSVIVVLGAVSILIRRRKASVKRRQINQDA